MNPSANERVIEHARESARAVARALKAPRRHFTISKFDRHADGYLHARVVVNGKPHYFHCRYGSWLAPGRYGEKAVLKEPEAVLGTALGTEVKFALAERGRERRWHQSTEEEVDA